jgi:phosphatidylserine/phosphatidylglycerophosphate/cardiolipin synthase-like enzyme
MRIFEYHRSFLHAKVAVIDDHWATVGSSNIDPFSLLLAREANVFVDDAPFRCRAARPSLETAHAGSRRARVAGCSRLAAPALAAPRLAELAGLPAGAPDAIGIAGCKAVTRAADHLHIQRSLLAKVLGISAATVSRLYSGAYQLDQKRKEWELAVLFVRAFRSLDSIVGEQETACKWLASNNRGLNGRPVDLIANTEGLVRVVHYLDASRSLV